MARPSATGAAAMEEASGAFRRDAPFGIDGVDHMGGVTGFAIAAHGGPVVGGTLSDAGTFPPFFWSRDGGDLRIAHSLGTHAMQAVPGFALLAGPDAAGVAPGWLALGMAACALVLAGIPLMP